jgi:protein-S-isoprenylcysteine O-methyltransferase
VFLLCVSERTSLYTKQQFSHSFPFLSSPSHIRTQNTTMSSSNGHPHISSPMATSSTAQAASQRAHDLLPHAPQYSLRGSLPNTPLTVSVISALLGGLVGASTISAVIPSLYHLGLSGWVCTSSRLGWYGAAMGLFHLLEFWTTAGWNPQKLSVDGGSDRFGWSSLLVSCVLTSIPAFLLNNTTQYWFAHAFGVAEYLVSSAFFPGKFSSGPWTSPVWSLGGMSAFLAESRNPLARSPYAKVRLLVIALLVGGQALRSLAMIHASTSFSHVVKAVKHDDHVLITHGVYA